MNHVNRCGNGCRNLVKDPAKYPAGACHLNGVILKMAPECRQWMDLHGCCSYRPPISDIIEVD